MDLDALRTWLDQRTADHLFSGVAEVWRAGESVFAYHGGLAHRGHGVPVTDRTRFGVASITKLATATAALRLVERGLVRLDDALVDLLPADRRPAAVTPELRLRHLLSHTSGLADYHDDDDQGWSSFTANWDRLPTYRVRRPADLLPLFADRPAVRGAGAAYRYTDANFVLVGLVIEAVTRSGLRRGPRRRGARTGRDGRLGSRIPWTRSRRGWRPATSSRDGPYEAWPANIFSIPVARHARRRDDHDHRRPRPAHPRPARRPAPRPGADDRDDDAAGPDLRMRWSSTATAASSSSRAVRSRSSATMGRIPACRRASGTTWPPRRRSWSCATRPAAPGSSPSGSPPSLV